MKINITKLSTGSIVLILLVAFIFNNCTPKNNENEVQRAAELIRDYAIKSNPALKGSKLKVSMSIDGGIADCMCIKVCNSKGENCTPCTCIPADCGGCD